MKISRLIYYLLFVFALGMFASCSMRYSHIPRSHNWSKQTAKKPTGGHYVSPQKENHTRLEDTSTFTVKPKLRLNLKNKLPIKELSGIDTMLNWKNPPAFVSRHYVDSTVNTPAPKKVDRSLTKDSGFLFAALTVINGAALATAYYNYMTLALVIAVGAVAFGYLLSKLVKNISDNRLKPPQYRQRDMYETRRKLKRATGILFGIAGVLYAIALLLVNTAAFDASFGFFVAGTLVLYIALIVGFIYLVAGLF
jgi:hypothetical protein